MRALAPALLLLAAPAWADVGEAALRPTAEIFFGTAPAVFGETVDYTGVGGGVLLSYGLSYSLAATARYGFEQTGTLQAEPAPGRLDQFAQQRHLALAGLAWAPSDQLTPVVLLEGGVAARRQYERLGLFQGGSGDLQVDSISEPQTDLLPLARLTALLEWRVTDFVSVAGGGLAEYSDGRLGYGAQLMVGLYRYL